MTYPGGMPVSNAIFNKALEVYRNDPSTVEDDLLSALEAVAPLLIAQGILEAVKVLDDNFSYIDNMTEMLRARAQELDPK